MKSLFLVQYFRDVIWRVVVQTQHLCINMSRNELVSTQNAQKPQDGKWEIPMMILLYAHCSSYFGFKNLLLGIQV